MVQEVDDGKSFYTGGGHTIEAWAEPLFIEHILKVVSSGR